MRVVRKGKRVFIYVRVSTQEQAKEGYSIEEQIERLTKYCEAQGWIVVKIFTDAGYSGGNTDRPALQEMIQAVEQGRGDSVLVYKLDRLSRSQKDTLELIEDVFLANNVDFVSMNENFDTSTPFGRAMIGILAVFAQLEREQIKERMSMGREGRAKEGKYHGGGTTPIGYDYINGELVINEYEKLQIIELFDLFTNGSPIGRIERLFLNKGYRHKYGIWDMTRMKRVLSNKLYIGYIKFNGQYFKGNHTAIIDPDTFEKAQKILQTRQQSVAPVRNSTYLGGLIFCKKCTARYCVYNTYYGGNPYRYYACHSRRKTNLTMVKDPNCKNKTYRMEVLDNIVFDEIRKLATDPSYIHEIKHKNFSDEDLDKEKILKNQIEKIVAQKSRFTDLYGIGEYTIEEVQEKVAPLNEQKKKLEAELKSLTSGKSEMTEEEVVEIVSEFGDILDRGIHEEIRLVIDALIDRIEIDEEDVIIHWKFA